MSASRRPSGRLLRRAVAAVAVSLLTVTSAWADELVVSAAASLTNAFKDVAAGFERQHPGTKVVLNFGASDVLMQQIVNGAPADVFASADETAMDKAAQAGVIDTATRKNFAANSLVMIVPADSRLSFGSPRELIATPEVRRIALADPASVPAGRYAQQALEADGKDVWDAVKAKSVLATNVRQCLDYVARGEAEAGFVFGTDAAIAKGRVKVAATLPTRTPVTYPIALVKSSSRGAQARAFEDYVLSPEGQAMLAKYGFRSPASK